LHNRRVIEELTEKLVDNPNFFMHTTTWAPADEWCAATIEDIKKTINEDFKQLIFEHENYSVDVINHKSELKDVAEQVSSLIKGKLSDHPQKIIRIELFDKLASITLIKPSDVIN